MLQVMEQTGRQQVDCSRDAGQQQQMSDRRQWQAAIGGRQELLRINAEFIEILCCAQA